MATYRNRKFQLISAQARKNTDLREYKYIITAVVAEIAPDAHVTVKTRYYQIDRITKSQIVLIGRKLAQTVLIDFNTPVCRIFTGFEGDKEE